MRIAATLPQSPRRAQGLHADQFFTITVVPTETRP